VVQQRKEIEEGLLSAHWLFASTLVQFSVCLSAAPGLGVVVGIEDSVVALCATPLRTDASILFGLLRVHYIVRSTLTLHT